MIRPVLSLLAVLPMLMPPGMCLCQFVPARAGGSGTSPSPTPAEARHADDCRCESCRTSDAPSAPADDTRTNHQPTDGSRPAPRPGWPCCPVALNAAGANTAVPIAPVLLPFTFPAGPVDLVTGLPCSPFARPDRDHEPSHGPPLFICHCALLI